MLLTCVGAENGTLAGRGDMSGRSIMGTTGVLMWFVGVKSRLTKSSCPSLRAGPCWEVNGCPTLWAFSLVF